MPYPPPPGPPGDSIFQGIGLNPEEGLPDQTGHSGDFLETDGTDASWQPVSGGGGGISIIGPVTTPTPNAAIISGIGSDTLQLAVGNASSPGIVSTAEQEASGLKIYLDQAATEFGDVRAHGAVANDTTVDFAQAFYNACACAVQSITTVWPLIATNTTAVSVKIPVGNFYTSMPLCVPRSALIAGVEAAQSIIVCGIGDGSGADVSSFCGPLVYVAPPYTPADSAAQAINFPTYSTPLVGATGQSLVLHDNSDPTKFSTSVYWLHDAWCWGSWIGNDPNATNFSIQFWVRVDDPVSPGFVKGIVGSRGPPVWISRGGEQADIAFGVYAIADGATLKLRAYLTTNPAYVALPAYQFSGTLYTIDSGNITPGASVHVELDYNGSFFDFYVDGVNQGHVGVTGPIIKAPWEGVSLGAQGPEGLDLPVNGRAGINGAIDSLRFSNIARHTGTGSFTPPSSKYTWDGNTLALYNWDQGVKTVQPKNPDGTNAGPLLTLPFLLGQTRGATGQGVIGVPTTTANPVTHYIRLYGAGTSPATHLKNFCVSGWQGCAGIVVSNSMENKLERIWTTQTSSFGIRIGTAVSYFCHLDDCRADWGVNVGIQWFGDLRRAEVGTCGIGGWMAGGGLCDEFNNQPAYTSYIGLLFDADVNTIICNRAAYDAEAYIFTRQLASGVVLSAGPTTFSNNDWNAISSPAVAPFVYFRVPSNGAVVHINDKFAPNTDGLSGLPASDASGIAFLEGVPTSSIVLLNRVVNDFNTPQLPFSNVDGWITGIDGKGITNLQGASVSETAANNFAGTFQIQDNFTQAIVSFLTPEPDANYLVYVTPQDYLGAAPAAGAETVGFPITKTQYGFTVPIMAAPGVGSTANYAWEMVRSQPPPLYFDFNPSIPSSFANPMAGQVDPRFYVGVTVRPASGNVFVLNSTQTFQTIIEAGTTIAASDYYESAFELGGSAFYQAASTRALDIGAFVSNGKLINILNPGAHNFVIGSTGLGDDIYIDGQHKTGLPGRVGTQPTTVYVGQRFDGSDQLTIATLHNLKMDPNPVRVISSDNDIGPGTQTQGAFFGDEWTVGSQSTTALGGFASQVANIKYGEYYYWNASVSGARITQTNPAANEAILPNIWAPWQGQSTAQHLDALVVLIGWHDILDGKTSAQVFPSIVQVLEGTAASANWFPPNSVTTPTDQRAWAALAVPRDPSNPGTCNFTVDGVPFPSTFTTDGATTATNLANAINANVTLNTYLLATANYSGNGNFNAAVKVTVTTPVGASGNGIPLTADGGAGGFCFGDIGGGFSGIALNVLTTFGVDNYVTIGSVRFVANFDTDATTTLNNLVTAINGDPTTSALVTASNTGTQVNITANSNGAAGNEITLGGNAINTPGPLPVSGFSWDTGSARHMLGGSNGAIQNGTGTILLCTVPPIGTVSTATGPMETQLGLLNAAIAGYVGAGVTVVDVNTLLADPGTPANILPAYDAGGGSGLPNDAAHVALYNEFSLQLPMGASPPSALSYATNPASYASGGPIASNNPTVTGSVTRYSVDPPLPTGLSLNATNGHVTGTPTTPTAAADYRIVAANQDGATFAALNITIT